MKLKRWVTRKELWRRLDNELRFEQYLMSKIDEHFERTMALTDQLDSAKRENHELKMRIKDLENNKRES